MTPIEQAMARLRERRRLQKSERMARQNKGHPAFKAEKAARGLINRVPADQRGAYLALTRRGFRAKEAYRIVMADHCNGADSASASRSSSSTASSSEAARSPGVQ